MKQFLLVAAIMSVGGAAYAAVPAQWKACTKEIQRYCPDATDSKVIFECIEGREKMGKTSGLSKACYRAHEKMEGSEHEAQEKGEGAEQRHEPGDSR
jgi:hypothetical protein